MNYWLMKSEPDAYSIDDLRSDKRTSWDGVRNYQVRNFMRDEMMIGDKAILYHSSAGKDTGAAGEMEVVGEAHPDKTQFDTKSEYYDQKSTKENPRWWCVDLGFVNQFQRTVPLTELKSDQIFNESRLTQKGNRLSVVPLTKKQYERICQLAKK